MLEDYCKVIDHLPKVPQEFLLSAEDIQELMWCATPPELLDHGYGSFLVPDGLSLYLQEYFDHPVIVRYQVILNDHKLHIDTCEQTYKYNYVYITGGDQIITSWYPENNQPVSLECVPETWYKLHVKVPHDAIGITKPRCSITIKGQI